MVTEDPCAKLPPASSSYSPKGNWDTVAGLNTYVTGDSYSTRAVIFIYDIFGPAPQSLQGADRLASSLNGLKAAFAKFRAEQAGIPPNVERLLEVRRLAGEKWPSVGEDGWGVFGLCWGGKIGVLVSGKDNEGTDRKFSASGTAHPSRLDAQDAEALTVPYLCLASPGEPADVVAQYKEILSKPGKVGVVKTYDSMFHGWMGGRAKLDDEKNRAEYERGYDQTAEFFGKYLST
ncbi:putative Dienelactone hydrolase family protein [Seiridium cardinale]